MAQIKLERDLEDFFSSSYSLRNTNFVILLHHRLPEILDCDTFLQPIVDTIG